MNPPALAGALAIEAPGTRAGELRALLRLALPLVGANLLQMAVYSSDVIFVARLGSEWLAASTLGVYIFAVVATALLGLVGSVAPLIAAELGRHRHAVREVRRSVRMGLWLAAMAGLPGMLVLANGGMLLRVLGQDPSTVTRADGFLRILSWALIPTVAASVLRTAVAALGRPGWAMTVAALALLTNLAGNWLLVFGQMGLPRLGIRGSATASVITSGMMVIAYGAILRLDRRLRRYRLLGNWWRAESNRLKQLARLGIPIALTMTFEGAVFSAAAFLMGLIGVTEVAAHAVALQVAALTFQVPFSIGQAATIRVGMAFGSGDRVWVARAGWIALALGIGFMAVTAAAIWTMPRLFISAYFDVDATANRRMVALAVQYLGWPLRSSCSTALRWWPRARCAACRIPACR